MNSSPDIYENGRPELVEWELFQIVLDLTFLKKRIPTKVQTQIWNWWVWSLEVIILQSNLLIENPEVENENDIGQVWQVWGRSPAVVCHHRELQQLLNRHCRFFPSTCQKKRATWKGVKSVETTSTYLHSTIARWYLRLIHLDQGTLFYHSILTGAYPYLEGNLRLTYWRLAVQKLHCGRVYEVECCNWWICQKCSADI